MWEIPSFPQEPVPGPPACPSHQPHRRPLIWCRKKLLSEPRRLQLLGRPVLPVSLASHRQELLFWMLPTAPLVWPGPCKALFSLRGQTVYSSGISLTSRLRLGIELGLQTAEPLSKAWLSAPAGSGEQAWVRLDPQELSNSERQRKQWAGSRSCCGHKLL